MSLWMEPLQVFKRVVFGEFGRKYHNFLNIKTKEWDQKIYYLITEMILS